MIAGLRHTLAVVAIGCLAAPAGAQTSKSAPLAAELAQLMQQKGLQNVAAKDPAREGFYVAASHIPGVQLLVVSARSNAKDYLDYVLAASRYDEVYSTLHATAEAEGKLFVQDMGADGVVATHENGGQIDVVYRDAVRTTVFNGDWKRQDMTEKEYGQAFQDIDSRYAKELSLLIEKLKNPA